MTIFERIKFLATKQGKSLQKVSEELGFSSNYLYQLKRQVPAADKLAIIADYFHVSVDYLLGREKKTVLNREPRKHRIIETKIKYSDTTSMRVDILGIKRMSFFSKKELDNAILHKLDIESSILDVIVDLKLTPEDIDEILLMGDLQGVITSDLEKNAVKDILNRSTIKTELYSTQMKIVDILISKVIFADDDNIIIEFTI